MTTAFNPPQGTAITAPRTARSHEPRRHEVQKPGRPLAAVATLTRTNLLGFVREPFSLVMEFAYPLFMLAVFRAVFSGDIIAGVSYAQYLLPAMITTGIMTTCLQNLAVTVAGERETGALKRLALLPVPAWAHVVSKCVSNGILAVLNATLLILVARFAMGIELPTAASSWGLLLATTGLMVATCTALGLAVGRSRPTQRAASGIVVPVVIILQFVSGIFFPLAQLPAWMVHTFSILPVRWSAELMREALLPASFAVAEPTGSWETSKGLWILVAWLVGGVAAAVVLTRRDTVDR